MLHHLLVANVVAKVFILNEGTMMIFIIKALLLFLTFSCALLALVPPSSGYNIGNFIFLLLFVVFFWLTIRKKK